MIIDLPLENWTDIFGFLPRPQLVELVPHINDRQFIKPIIFFLNKCGEVTLGKFRIWKGPVIIQLDRHHRELPLADVPMPMNTKNFTKILINYFDESVFSVLQEFHHNSLLENVHLGILYNGSSTDMHALPKLMANLLPMISSIDSISIDDQNVLDLLKMEYSKWAIPMLTSARVLSDSSTNFNSHTHAFFSKWLYTPTKDGKPRVLILEVESYQNDRSVYYFVERVKKEFLMAKHAISFFIQIHLIKSFRRFFPNEDLSMDNHQTNEKLVITTTEGDDHARDVLISRHPIGANAEWIKEMSQVPDSKHRKILINIQK